MLSSKGKLYEQQWDISEQTNSKLSSIVAKSESGILDGCCVFFIAVAQKTHIQIQCMKQE